MRCSNVTLVLASLHSYLTHFTPLATVTVQRTAELVTKVQAVFRGHCARRARQIEYSAEPERRALRRYYRLLAAEHVHHLERVAGIVASESSPRRAVDATEERVQQRYDRECWWIPQPPVVVSDSQ
eukprot:SAG31_NODE_3149_length_4618_cov_1.653242_3_plen_126_part_00